jgi:hypothetical protein
LRRERATVVVIRLKRLAAIKVNLILYSVVVAVQLGILTIVSIIHFILISIHKALMKRIVWLAITELVWISIVRKSIRIVILILVIIVRWLVIVMPNLVSAV